MLVWCVFVFVEELVFAVFTTEIIFFSIFCRDMGGSLWIDCHAADGVLSHYFLK